MSGIEVEWIVILLCFLLFFGWVSAEVLWLVRKGWANPGRSIGYVIVTNLLGLGISSTVVLILFFVMFMLVMGPAGTGGNAPEGVYWAISIIAIILPPVILTTVKRLFLLLFKMKDGRPAWIYSLVTSLLMLIFVLVPPPLFYYLLRFLPIWK